MDKLQKILSWLLVLLIIVLVASYFTKDKLPAGYILPEMLKEPIQKETIRKPFSFIYRGTKYNVIPQADYELWGMITTKNNIKAWYNFYHDKNSVNIKDVCVIWGDNISSKAYTAMKFTSGEWTCYWQYPAKVANQYKKNELSNNHLLSDNPKVLEVIKKMEIGDQIYLKGSLVDYGAENVPTQYYRKTSLSRDDANQTSRSGGSCEVMFVDEAKILAKNSPVWHWLFTFSKFGIIFLISLRIILFIIKSIKPRRIDDAV